ncbi:MAG: DUF4124 domain-containing protein [Gammaproteobacteria bacterium]|nr:DUF4124 domain-containing protein [Gammaproteobacteria bacterium]
MRIGLLTLSIVLLMSPLAAQAKLYKWVDDKGRVHFGDRIPYKYQLKAHDELNEGGVVVKHNDAAKTREQKIEEKRLEKERKKIALAEKRAKQRDRVLLDTYTTMRDLIVARDARLDAVDSQIQLAETIISDSNTNIASLERQVIQIKASNREVPGDVYQRIDSEKQQVKVQSKVKDGHIKRRDEISVQFNGYIERFNALKAEQKEKRERLARKRDELL